MRPEFRNIPFEHHRFRNGPIDLAATDLGLLPVGSDAMIDFFEDFTGDRGTLASAAGVYGWHEDASGTPTAIAIEADGHGGVALMKPGSTSTNNVHYQWAVNTTVVEPFTMAVGKRLWIKARFKIEDADQNLLIFGLHEAADDPWATEPNDQFVFRSKASAAATLQCAIGTTNSTEKAGDLAALSDDTWYRVEAFYDGVSTVTARLMADDGTEIAKAVIDASSTVIPTTPMTVAFGVEALDTGADDFRIDYIAVRAER